MFTKMYFIYNGVDSRTLGISIREIPFDILTTRRIEEIVLDKYDGTIYKDNNTYDSYSLSIECLLVDSLDNDTVLKIKNTFKTGRGQLVLSTRPDYIYSVRLSNTLNFAEMLEKVGSCILTFKVEPFATLESGLSYVTVPKGGKLTNLGNYESKPLIKAVGGTGIVSITINGKTMDFKEVSSTFFIDMELEDIYGENGENLNLYMTLESDFIPLSEGDNTITYTGLTALYIMPRWRVL